MVLGGPSQLRIFHDSTILGAGMWESETQRVGDGLRLVNLIFPNTGYYFYLQKPILKTRSDMIKAQGKTAKLFFLQR